MRDTFPFSFRVSQPKRRSESAEWMQRVGGRFDYKKTEKLGAKLNYGTRYKSNASTYISAFQK